MPDAPQTHETLKFFFTPTAPPRPDADNPHAKTSTQVQDVAEALRGAFGEAVADVSEYAGEVTVRVAPDRWHDVASALYTDHGFTYLSDLTAVDRFTEEERFEVVLNLIALDAGQRLRLTTRVDEENAALPTLTDLWHAAGWNEREVWDMFGIRFDGHEDLRRMYMPEDFEYHPLRKEFPLLGIPGSLPLPPNRPDGGLIEDPFPAAHGNVPLKSYEEPKADEE